MLSEIKELFDLRDWIANRINSQYIDGNTVEVNTYVFFTKRRFLYSGKNVNIINGKIYIDGAERPELSNKTVVSIFTSGTIRRVSGKFHGILNGVRVNVMDVSKTWSVKIGSIPGTIFELIMPDGYTVKEVFDHSGINFNDVKSMTINDQIVTLDFKINQNCTILLVYKDIP